MSKPSRRVARIAGTPADRPTTAGATPAGAAGGTTGATPAAGTTGSRPPGTRPPAGRTPGTRVGRRDRPRTGYSRRPFWERYRGPLITLAVVAAVALIGAFAIQSTTASSYACSTDWSPGATPSPDPSGSGRLGLVQPDMGREHSVGSPQRYTYCPPASGNHYNRQGLGPIEARLYGPDDPAGPQNWTHNLEHAALVLVYRCGEGDTGCDDATQAELRQLLTDFPDSPVCGVPPGGFGPVIARFDDMAWPFAAIVWGRVLPLETLDRDLVYRFWELEGERSPNMELACVPPSPSPSAPAVPSGSAEASPGASGAPSGSPDASGSAAESAPAGTSPSPAAS